MFTALLTFLGGTAMRVFLGHMFDFITKWQDNKNELARMRLQNELDQSQFERQQQAIRLQADMGIKVIEAQTVSHVTKADSDAFVEAVRATGQRVGVVFIDAWNGCVRPFLATVCIILWIASMAKAGWVLTEWDQSVISLALGVFIGGRIHAKGT